MAKYRAGVIGLGWMGMLYDLATRIPDRFDIDDVDRPTPRLDVHRRFYHHDHPGTEGNPTSLRGGAAQPARGGTGDGSRPGPETARGVQRALRDRGDLHGCRRDAARRASGHRGRRHEYEGTRRSDVPGRGVRCTGHRYGQADVSHARGSGPHGSHVRRCGRPPELWRDHDDPPLFRQSQRTGSERGHRGDPVNRGARTIRSTSELVVFPGQRAGLGLGNRRPAPPGGGHRRVRRPRRKRRIHRPGNHGHGGSDGGAFSHGRSGGPPGREHGRDRVRGRPSMAP